MAILFGNNSPKTKVTKDNNNVITKILTNLTVEEEIETFLIQ